jgi:predicted metal-dependent hydrolase
MTTHNIDKVVRSKRKTLALLVSEKAQLIVKAPMTMSYRKILDFVYLKRKWIKKKKQFVLKSLGKVSKKRFVDSEAFLFLGKEYPLKIVNLENINLGNSFEFPKKFLPDAGENIKKWYKEQGKKKLAQRIDIYSQEMRLSYRSVSVTNARKRLGSCGPKRTLNFSWLLILMPLKIIDYIVVHELVHLEVKNHSKHFWNRVALMIPDYKKRVEWLKDNYLIFSSYERSL